MLAIGATVAGLEAVFGKAGIALGALTMVFIGNPFSGVASSPEMLPSAAGTLGQLLPPGRRREPAAQTGFFDGAGRGGHVAVLAAWALFGLALLGVASLRRLGSGCRGGAGRVNCCSEGGVPLDRRRDS